MSVVKSIIKSPLKLFNQFMACLGYRRSTKGYQDSRFPKDQYKLISNTSEYKSARNSLEIGCNQGKLVQLFCNDNLFASGVDLMPYWAYSDNSNAVLGANPISLDNVSNLPEFDIICLLSVHHQWVIHNGDEYAKNLIEELLNKSQIAMYIEFAAIADKYGYVDGERFTNNDEASIRQYVDAWLNDISVIKTVVFLGKTRELEGKEPYRYMFQIKKK